MNLWQRLFGKKQTAPPDRAKTAPLDPGTLEGHAPLEGRRHVMVGSAQSSGIERTHNEDALLVLTGNAGGAEAIPDFGIFLVADGMGGHRAGEVASMVSAQAVARRLTLESILTMLDPNGEERVGSVQDSVRLALEAANEMVVERVPGGGTTLTTVLLLGDHLTIGHVGDSRAYLIQNGQMQMVTRDHSLVERLRELGQLSRQEAADHPQRNVLYRAIGQGANLEVDVTTHPVPRGGYLLICSDGLWGVVSDEEISQAIAEHSGPQAACDALVRAANNQGGPDNITVILAYFPPI
jgi:serine/threonine protein phosphatase PrpC